MTTVKPCWIFINGVCGTILMCLLFTLEIRCSTTHSTDNDTLLNVNNFQYVMNNASICSRSAVVGDPSSIVILIHTARSHFANRYAIRETWGSVKLYQGWTFHLVFLLGIDPTGRDELDTRLSAEGSQHGDMVMGNFVDSYRNLTYKHLMGYKWVASFCSDAKLVLKTDDDMFVDVFRFVEVIVVEFLHSDKAYACVNMAGNKPVRGNGSVWCVTEAEFPGDTYPAFCSGTVYVMKTPVAAKIYSISNQLNYLFIDDLFVTGILREHYNTLMNRTDNIERLEIETWHSRCSLHMGHLVYVWCNTSLNDHLPYTFVLLLHDEIIRDMLCFWKKIRNLKFAVNHAVQGPERWYKN